MDYRREILSFIKEIITKDESLRQDILNIIDGDKEKNLYAHTLTDMLMKFNKQNLRKFLDEHNLLEGVKVNTKTTKQQLIIYGLEKAKVKNKLEEIPKLIEIFNDTIKVVNVEDMLDIDIFTEVMIDKNILEHKLRQLNVSQLKHIIKTAKLVANKNIAKEKDKNNLVEYILAEAERQMKSATII